MAAALGLLAAFPSMSAYADKGVELSTGAIAVKEAIARGRGYDLPPITVRNPGNELTNYSMSVETQSGSEQQVNPAWFKLSPTEFTLVPGTAQEVAVAFAVPSDAKAGNYSTLIVASVAQPGEGASVGAAAATKLDFHVQGGGGFGVPTPALYALLAAGGLGAVGWLARRKLSIRIERRPSR
jgi:hypothetical protein